MRKNLLFKSWLFIRNNWLPFLAAITTIIVFLPLNPNMPQSGLDPSWRFAINAAVAQNLQIGKDIIFPFGPYASMSTQTYYPETFHLMLFGSLFLGLCYAFCLFYIGLRKNSFILIPFIAFIVAFIILKDALFYSYPLLLVVCTYVYISGVGVHQRIKFKTPQIIALVILSAPLGLLPLVKGTLLIICIIITIFIASYFYYHKYRMMGVVVLVSPIASSVLFWVLAGQAITSFPSYFINSIPIISGYAEAMSTFGVRKDVLDHLSSPGSDLLGQLSGPIFEILCYLAGSFLLLWTLTWITETRITKVFLLLSFGLVLFIAFKGGFVRHDGHATIASESFVFACLMLNFINKHKHSLYLLILSIIIWVYIDKTYINTSTKTIFNKVQSTFVGSFEKLNSAISGDGSLVSQYQCSLEVIRKEKMIPSLIGTTDIYSYDQSYLLVSENRWNPRPVFQSYQVYTPYLARINEQHLRGSLGPDNILFTIQPIDGRFPSLEDGLSWPAIFDNYMLTKLDNNIAYLSKKKIMKRKSNFNDIYQGQQKVGDKVLIPESSLPLYAEIDINPNLFGRLLGIAFKPTPLMIKVRLKNDSLIVYRVIANMMKSGFFLSPLVATTRDFVCLATGNEKCLNRNTIKSIEIIPPSFSSFFWNKTYILRLKAYIGNGSTPLPTGFLNEN